MTAQGWLVIVFLVAAAAAVAWPVRAGRARQRVVLGPVGRNLVPPASHVAGPAPGFRSGGARTTARGGRRGTRSVAERPLPVRPPGRHDATHPAAAPGPADGCRPRAAVAMSPTSAGAAVTGSAGGASDVDHGRGGPTVGQVPGGPVAVLCRAVILPEVFASAGRVAARFATGGRLAERVAAPARQRDLLLAALSCGGAGAVLGGPVAAVVLAAYGVLAARAVRRRRARQLADRARRRELDQLCALAADLRAGLPAGNAAVDGPHRIARLARAAVRLADRTGAPLAELLERVEADARAADRGLAAAAAQAAGSRATAWLLAALPLGGIGLGYAIGVDPVSVLLHTTIGGGSALAAVALQIGGLLWAERLGATPGRDD
ncbi:hypothetical protein ABZ570_15445 [Micromonospora sp. NPDC007271]|uniref:type II secretion system F family protein n=1 Tax=Micromonospora sp. NPDC007271 TaxID=3154587 RepID=UPI0033C5E1E1